MSGDLIGCTMALVGFALIMFKFVLTILDIITELKETSK